MKKSIHFNVALLLPLLLALSLTPADRACARESKERMAQKILETLNTEVLRKDNRGGLITEYEYEFLEPCRFKVHSSWIGNTHGDIYDAVIPLGKVQFIKEFDFGNYFLSLKCRERKKCIFREGFATEGAYKGKSRWQTIPGGATEEEFQQLKKEFQGLGTTCAKQ